MMFLSILYWLGTVGSITGQIFVIKEQVLGFKIWTFSAILQIILAITSMNVAQIVLWIFFLVMDIIGWFKWNGRNKSEF